MVSHGLKYNRLNPAHVPCWWMNNPTLGPCCEAMIGRADIEESKSNVAVTGDLIIIGSRTISYANTTVFAKCHLVSELR